MPDRYTMLRCIFGMLFSHIFLKYHNGILYFLLLLLGSETLPNFSDRKPYLTSRIENPT